VTIWNKRERSTPPGSLRPQVEAGARVTFFDDAVDRFLPDVDQFVILGAGFDTRPYRLPKDTPVRSFEVETPKNLSRKQRELLKSFEDASNPSTSPASTGFFARVKEFFEGIRE